MKGDTDDFKEKYRVLLWRFVAVIHFSAWAIKCILRFFVFDSSLHNWTFFPKPAYIIIYCVTIIVAAFLIFFPLQIRIYVAVFFTWGVIHLIEKSSIIGIAEYVLALMFAYHLGFFKTYIRLKVCVLVSILFAALVWQIRDRFLTDGAFLLWCLEFALVVGIGIVLFLSELTRKQQAEESLELKKPVSALSAFGLAPDDIHILTRILQKEKYKSIAGDYKISVPTFERRARQLFTDIGVASQRDFCRQYFDDNGE